MRTWVGAVEGVKKMKLKFKNSRAELDRIACSSDSSCIQGQASLVYFPESVNELANIVRQNPSLVIRGGGSGLVGGCVPLNDAVVDLSKLNRIFKIDRVRKTAEVEAGIILDELQEELDKYNLEFPVQPSSHSICTIGGMIATNAVGSRAIKYGRMQNWVEEIEIVNAKGNIEKKGKVDLSDYTGMEGITGIIVKAKLKLIEKKERTASLLRFHDIEEMTEIVKKLKSNSEVSMIEFFDKIISNLLELEPAYYLIVEYESDKGSLKGRDYEEVMRLRDNIYPVLSGKGYVKIEDPKLFLNKIPEFLSWLESEKIPCFGHLGSGIIHACFKKNDKREKEILIKAKKMHGKVSGEHGIGLMKKDFIEESEKKILRNVKKRIDPGWKFNRNKFIDYEGNGEEKEEKIKEKDTENNAEKEKDTENKINNEIITKEVKKNNEKELIGESISNLNNYVNNEIIKEEVKENNEKELIGESISNLNNYVDNEIITKEVKENNEKIKETIKEITENNEKKTKEQAIDNEENVGEEESNKINETINEVINNNKNIRNDSGNLAINNEYNKNNNEDNDDLKEENSDKYKEETIKETDGGKNDS